MESIKKKERPQDRWNRKAGYISKSYKLKKVTADRFAEACKAAGVSQAGTLTKLMNEFADKHLT